MFSHGERLPFFLTKAGYAFPAENRQAEGFLLRRNHVRRNRHGVRIEKTVLFMRTVFVLVFTRLKFTYYF